MGDDGIVNTQKMLPNDTHIIYFQKSKLWMMPAPVIKVLKNHFQMMPIS